MKTQIRRFTSFCALVVAAHTAAAVVYTDTVGDTFTTHGGGILDITSVEVYNTATELVFKINLAGNPVATDWGKYMIALDTRPGGDPVGNGWNRPISLTSGMDYWIGTWVDGGNGGEVREYGPPWVMWSATYSSNPDNISVTKDTSSVTIRFRFDQNLLLNIGDNFDFDVYTSGGGGSDSAIDSLANPNQTISWWTNPYATNLVRTYTLVAAAPPNISNVSPTNGAIYVPVSTPISFAVSSDFSTIPTNKVQLTLNGAPVTGLNFSGTPNNWTVTATPTLLVNREYVGRIIAEDADGWRATNTFTFNSWSAYNPFIEAEDYNFGGGGYIDNFANLSPNQLYAGLLGVNGVDFLEGMDAGTNYYRPGDWIDTEPSGDVDHNDFLLNGYQDYNLSWIQFGEWANYTRRFSNQTYAVYARMASLSGDPVMLMERHASPMATTSNQPVATLGTFVCPANTGGGQSYVFVPLKDFFSQPVEIKFPGTNTFRFTRIGGGYNFTYVTLVPSTNTATLRPYIAAGFPYPGSGNVAPDQGISFTIANRETSVNPASIQLFVNGANVTSSLSANANAAGAQVSYQPTALWPLGSNVTVRAVFGDGSVTLTNDWQFSVANLLVLPPAFAVTNAAGANAGFTVRVAKAPNEDAAFVPFNVERVELHLAGLLTNNLGQPLVNEAAGPNNDGLFLENRVINYEQSGSVSGDGDTFTPNAPFPYVAVTKEGSYTNDPNFISLAASGYLELQLGIYRVAVRSDDGFRLTVGQAANPTNLIVMEYLSGRSSANPSVTDFLVQQAGLYPFKLQYFEGEFGASLEFYSIDRASGVPTLINATNVGAIKAWRSVAPVGPVITHVQIGGGNVEIFFTGAPTDTPANFVLQESSVVTPASAYADVSATITGGSGSFKAVRALGTAPKFYRIKRP